MKSTAEASPLGIVGIVCTTVTDNGNLVFLQVFKEVERSLLPLLLAGAAVVLYQAFIDREHLISLGVAIAHESRTYVVETLLEDVGATASALLDEIGTEVEVALVAGELVDAHHGLHHRVALDASAAPSLGIDVYLRSVAYLVYHAVGLGNHQFEHAWVFLHMCIVLRESEHDIFALPEVATLGVGLLFYGRAGYSTVALHILEHLVDGVDQYLLEFGVLVICIKHGSTANSLGPHLTNSEIGSVDVVIVELHEAVVGHDALVPMLNTVVDVIVEVSMELDAVV